MNFLSFIPLLSSTSSWLSKRMKKANRAHKSRLLSTTNWYAISAL